MSRSLKPCWPTINKELAGQSGDDLNQIFQTFDQWNTVLKPIEDDLAPSP